MSLSTVRASVYTDNESVARPPDLAEPEPVRLFRELVAAVQARRFQQAERVRKQLYALGWSCVVRPNALQSKGGRS